MRFNLRGRLLIHEETVGKCTKCQKIYDDEKSFCPNCGSKLLNEKLKIYANFGKSGLTSYTYKLPNGISINSRGTMTFSLAKGISYTSKTK